MLDVAVSVILALLLDKLLGETKRYHPLVGFGRYAALIESRLNKKGNSKWRGVCALSLALLPFALLFYVFFKQISGFYWGNILASAVVLYFCLGWQSLIEHAKAVSQPLRLGDIAKARQSVAMIVSRDTDNLNEVGIASAATESVLENGADAIFAALFWFAVGGAPAVVLYRLSNTLDAMWGYKTQRFFNFGWAAARFDDVMNFIPAQLTALSYTLVGRTKHTGQALRCWYRQGFCWKSPNAGSVMAAGAGAINTVLGGPAQYQQDDQLRPYLGPSVNDGGSPASALSIDEACRLVNRALDLWVLLFFLVSFVF